MHAMRACRTLLGQAAGGERRRRWDARPRQGALDWRPRGMPDCTGPVPSCRYRCRFGRPALQRAHTQRVWGPPARAIAARCHAAAGRAACSWTFWSTPPSPTSSCAPRCWTRWGACDPHGSAVAGQAVSRQHRLRAGPECKVYGFLRSPHARTLSALCQGQEGLHDQRPRVLFPPLLALHR